jgi:hypothetical protein
MVRKSKLVLVALAALVAAAIVALPAVAADPISGAIFTTDSACSGVDLNIYGNKDEVYLNGGPAHPHAAGLPDGPYYVKVTQPDGTLLGTSVGSANETPVHVTNGGFDQCYQLSNILIKASDGSAGYDDTANSGGEYKAWVSTTSDFANDNSKTDNFKVKPQEDGGPPPQATLHIRKYYDANANGQYDTGESYLDGWKFRIHDHIDWVRYTPANMVLDASTPLNTYYVSEYMPLQSNWIETDPSTGPIDTASSMEAPPVPATGTRVQQITLNNGDNPPPLEFGNVCLGAGGGLTLGFWSNSNGLAATKSMGLETQLAFLRSLNLIQNVFDKKNNITGTKDFDPTAYKDFQSWLLKADSTNMAYMLSAQLAAMELNVQSGKVSPSALIYSPGTDSANALGFATVSDVMNEANAALSPTATKGGRLTVKASANRTYEENLKIALDKGNNNLNFVQSSPCAFTFPK